MELIAATSVSRSNNFVFTSAGERSNLHGWAAGPAALDLRIEDSTAVHATAKLRYIHFRATRRQR
jgi:hypothetical protein